MADYWDSWDSNPANAKDCPTCNGSGVKTLVLREGVDIVEDCPDCGGSGEVTPNEYDCIINNSKEYEKDCD